MESLTRAALSHPPLPLRAGDIAWRCARALALVVLVACHRGSGDASPRIVVSNENDGTLSVIDLRTHTVVDTIAVGKRPRGVQISRDGKTAYVALSGSPKSPPGVDERTLPPADRTADGIGVVDLEDLELVRTIPSGQDPEAFDLAGDRLLVVSNEETAEVSIIDLKERAIRKRVPVGGEPEGVTTAPDGTVWVTSEAEHRVYAIDPAGTLLGFVATGTRPRTIAFTADGKLGVVGGELDASVTLFDPRERVVVARIAIPAAGGKQPRPMGVAIDRQSTRAFVTTGRGGSIAIIDLGKRVLDGVIEDVGARPWGIAVGRNGLLYTANGPSNDVSVVDPIERTVVRRIPTGGSPWGVAATR